MLRNSLLLLAAIGLFTTGYSQKKDKSVTVTPTAATDSTKAKKPNSFADKTKTSKRSDGLFSVYQDTASGSLQLYIRKDQLGKEYIYQSFSLNGPTSMYLNQSMHRANFVFKVEKAFDKLEFSKVNTSFYYDPSNPVSKTKDVDKPEAVILVEKIVAEDSAGYLVSADGLFISEKLDPIKPATPPSMFSVPRFNLGTLSPAKSKYHAVKTFPENTDIVVDLTYDNPNAFVSGGSDIVDPRYVRVRMQHSIIAIPENNYQPRHDDPRVGYFTRQVNDQTSINPTPYRDMIHRWHLVKKDPSAAISEPVEPIVFWIENTTPHEYRDVIMESGLKWNAAFEKAGFRNAVQMKVMPDDATWDPADIRYNVIRWVSSANPPYGAIGPSFVNPKTGQIIGADITVEWFTGSATPIMDELLNRTSVPSENMYLPGMDMQHLATCALASELKAQQISGSTALEVAGAAPGELVEMHHQFLTYLIMHEMGHTLGLNHNMKSSQLWSPEQINNKELTRKYGLIGSVMDYPAINVALDRSKQGDYYTTLAGPYDIWAIEYGYKPFPAGQEAAGLKQILSQSTDPKLAFGNDGDDMRSPGKAMDPRVNVNDLTSDAIGYAEERFHLVNKTMANLLNKYSKEGQSYHELRSRYASLNGQRYGMISAVSRYIGGVYVDRSFPEQKSDSKPFTPVSLAQQKRAMSILSKYVFSPDAFNVDAVVYAYLQPQRRGFNQSGSGDDYKITGNIMNMQLNGALAHLLNPAVLQRVTNSRLYGNKYSVADMLNDLNSGIFAADLKTNVNVYRQYLQSAYVKALANIIKDQSNQYDDVAQAGALNALKKIKTQMASAISLNEETKAHRANLVFIINNALDPK